MRPCAGLAHVVVVPDLVTASLGTRAGVIGAALLAREDEATVFHPPAPGSAGGAGGLVSVVAVDTVVLRGRVVAPRAVIDDGLVVCRAGIVEWVGEVADAPGGTAVPDRSDLTLLPGLVDVHCHGGGGHAFPDADADRPA